MVPAVLKRALACAGLALLPHAHAWREVAMADMADMAEMAEMAEMGILDPVSSTITGVVVGNSLPVTNGTLTACKPQKFEYYRRNAPYVSVHFSKFSLADGDVVTISNANGTEERTITKPPTATSGFQSDRIPGPTAIITFTPGGCSNAATLPSDFGFEIDAFKYTYETIATKEEACGASKQYAAAICYKGKAGYSPNVYKSSLAVARLMITSSGPTTACTGWLLGSQGHLVTNHHCISNAAMANATSVEFMVQSPACDESCRQLGDCRDYGKVESVGTDFVYANEKYDYAIVKLRRKPCVINGKYGFLSLRKAAPVENEKIYLVHHPNGGAKIITAEQDIDNLDNDPTTGSSGVTAAVVAAVNDENNLGDFWTSYYADTERGSSGTPVISMDSHQVIAVHSNGACKNSGAPSHLIIADIQANNIALPADAFA